MKVKTSATDDLTSGDIVVPGVVGNNLLFGEGGGITLSDNASPRNDVP